MVTSSFLATLFVLHAAVRAQSGSAADSPTSLGNLDFQTGVFTPFDVYDLRLDVYRVRNRADAADKPGSMFFFESRPFAVCGGKTQCEYWNERVSGSRTFLTIKMDWCPSEVEKAAKSAVVERLKLDGDELASSNAIQVRPIPVKRIDFVIKEEAGSYAEPLPPFEWYKRTVNMGAAASTFEIGWVMQTSSVPMFKERMEHHRLEFYAPFEATDVKTNFVQVNVTAEQVADVTNTLFGKGGSLVIRRDALTVLRKMANSFVVNAKIEEPSQFSLQVLDFLTANILGAREALTPDLMSQLNVHTISPHDLACDKIQAKLDHFFEKTLSKNVSQRAQSDFDEAGLNFSIDGLFGLDASDSSVSSSSSLDLASRLHEQDIVVEWTGEKYECKNVLAVRKNMAAESMSGVASIRTGYQTRVGKALTGELNMDKVCSHRGCQLVCLNGRCKTVREAPPLRNSDIDEINRKIGAVSSALTSLEAKFVIATSTLQSELQMSDKRVSSISERLSVAESGSYTPVAIHAVSTLPSPGQTLHITTTSIPNSAKQVLVKAAIRTGGGHGEHEFEILIYTFDGNNSFAFSLICHSYNGEFWGYNSDQAWLPLVGDRIIRVTQPSASLAHHRFDVWLVGFK